MRGFRANKEELSVLLKSPPAVVCLQETLVTENNTLSLSGYTCLCSYVNRGICLCIRNDFVYSPIVLQSALEVFAARISFSKAITVCSVYLSPSQSITKKQLLELIDQLPSPYIIIGDFNAHSVRWGSDSTDIRGKVVEDVIDDLNLCVLNSGAPTFCAASGALSHIDLALCDPSIFLDLDFKVHSDLCGSDHFPILLHILTSQTEKPLRHWKFQEANWNLFQSLLLSHISSNILDNDNSIEVFSSIIVECANQAIPKSSGKIHAPKTPWFDEECKQLHRERKAAQRKFFRFPTVENKCHHQKLRAQTRRLFKEKKKQSWLNFCSSLNFQTSTKKVWNIIRKIKGKNSKAAIQCLKDNGETITDKAQIANLLASTIHFNSSSNNYSESFKKVKQSKEKVPCSFKADSSAVYNIPFSMSELKEALLKSNNSAPGHDDIHYQLLGHLPESSLEILLDIFNSIWMNGNFPLSWRKAIIIPIPKPGKDHSDPNNYRPIALTSCLCKTMERMVYERLMWQLEAIDALDVVQCGFRKNRSTVDHLIRYETFIRNAFVKGEHVVSILFDLEKAYDTTWKHGILLDLKELGFDGNLPLFIANFLTDRNFQVRIGSTLSDPFSQEMGVPQGSILSPLLFNLKINNIVKSVKPEIDKSLFVDDFSISASGKTLAGVERQLQLCVNKLQKWVDDNGFKFSVSKTECIHFHKKKNQVLQPDIVLNGNRIKVSNQVKFLGIIFDSKLSFLPHIKYLKCICQDSLNVLKVISHTDWGADRETLLRLYRSLVRSKLDYGCIVYGSARKSYLEALDPVHHQGLRIALGAFRTSPKDSLYAEAGEPPLELRRLRLSMNYYVKLKSNPLNPAYSCVFHIKDLYKFEQKPNEIPPFGMWMSKVFGTTDMNIDAICDSPLLTDLPHWKLSSPKVNLSLTSFKKNSTPDCLFKQKYLEESVQYKHYEKIFVDGSVNGDKVAAAAVSHNNFKCPSKFRLPDFCSIYTAELRGILLALNLILKSDYDCFLIVCDSLSVLQAFQSCKITHPLLVDIHNLHSLLRNSGFIVEFMWIPSHVGIYGNSVVDSAAKSALQMPISLSDSNTIPHSDLNRKINSFCRCLWQDHWSLQTNNKLFQFFPVLTEKLPMAVKNRKEETILTRLHIGHSYITHGFLLRKEGPPWCHGCDSRFSVKHFMTECGDLALSRERHLKVLYPTLGNVFRNCVLDDIFAFLKSTNLYSKI